VYGVLQKIEISSIPQYMDVVIAGESSGELLFPIRDITIGFD
jgi:hypothetical protein